MYYVFACLYAFRPASDRQAGFKLSLERLEKVTSQYICAMASLPDDMDTRIAKLRLELAEAEQEKKTSH